MKTTKISKKFNVKFFAILAGSLMAVFALCILVGKLSEQEEIPIGDLPEEIETNIPKLVINEVMANNGGIWVNENGQTADYIELYNGSGKDINLSGYGLSDRQDTIKWTFPDVTLADGAYLVVALTGDNEDGLNASFKLSSAGSEQLILTNRSGKVIDAVETIALGKNQVMARNANGSWECVNQATPGYPNSLSGRDTYLKSLIADEDAATECQLIISEILPKNKANYTNEYNKQEGFIELYNAGETAILLSDCYLSDSADLPFKSQLPSVTLQPGAYYLINCGNASYTETNYCGFSLNNNTGSVLLTYKGKIVQTLSYDGLENGYSYGLNETGTYQAFAVCSPGYANTVAGVQAFQEARIRTNKGLVINEVMSQNNSYLAQNGGNYYDWIEFYNNGTEAVDLSDYSLSNDSNNLKLFTLPAVTLEPGAYFVLMCSGDSALTNQSYYHADFKISEAESLYLSKNGTLVDSLFAADIPANYSYSRGTEEGLFYTTPTPAAANQTKDAPRLIANAPEISVSGGVYNDVDSITVALTAYGEIHYTLDGSVPTKSSPLYTEPLTFTKTTVLKAKTFDSGKASSDLVFASYIINENHTLPVMSVTISTTDFKTLTSNPDYYIQKQAWAEFYEDGSSFSVPCSLALFGGNTRYIPKKSFALRFDSEWGASSLNYPVFENRDNSCYDALVLRSGSTDYAEAIIRDVVGTSLVDEYTDVDAQAYKSCILYINGEYWGIYNIREKINAQFLADHYNVDVSDLDLMRIDGETTQGTRDRYNTIRAFARNNDLSDDANYAKICEMIDVDNIIDYWIAQTYTTNNDILNCRFFICDTIADGKLRYIYYDLDYAWYNDFMDYYTRYLTNPDGIGIHYNFENDIIRNLFKNTNFRARFLERLQYNMQYTWNPDIVLARINEIYELYLPEIERNQARWGLTVEHWESEVQKLRNWTTNRTDYLMNQTKSFFGLSNTEMKEVFGDLWQN